MSSLILHSMLSDIMESDDSYTGMTNLEVALRNQMKKAMNGDLDALKFLVERQFGKTKYGADTGVRKVRSRDEVFLEMQQRESRFLPQVTDAEIVEDFRPLPKNVANVLFEDF